MVVQILEIFVNGRILFSSRNNKVFQKHLKVAYVRVCMDEVWMVWGNGEGGGGFLKQAAIISISNSNTSQRQ
jgi:hypothetical protein